MEREVTTYARFYGILKQGYKFATKELGDEFKESVVSQFTDGRTTSLREMTRSEYDTMCARLEADIAHLLQGARNEKRKRRSTCLRLMQKLGIDTTDWTRINAFCEDPRIAGRPFGRLSTDELEQLSVKLRSIQRKGGLKPKKKQASVEAVPVQPDYLLVDLGKGGEA